MEYTPVFVYFYDGPFKKGNRRITSCLLIDEGGNVVARGLSLCSFSDQANTRLGRMIAESRARGIFKRLGVGKPSRRLPISRKEATQILSACFNVPIKPFKRQYFEPIAEPKEFQFKSEYMTEFLTEREQVVIANFQRKRQAA